MEEAVLNLCFYLNVTGHSVSPDSVKRELGSKLSQCTDVYDLVCEHLGYKVLERTIHPGKNINQPLIINDVGLGHCVIVRQEKELVHLFQARSPSCPVIIKLADLGESWNGRGLALERKFKATQVFEIVKTYCNRKTLTLILAASLLIQTFAIAIPLFSQVIVDKVLVHQNLSALYVFGCLMAVMVCAEFVFSIARIKVTVDTGKKIDAAISYRLYQTILEKPLSFFQESRVGTLVNMARRANVTAPLITSGTLFNSLDLVFTSVFFAIMLSYSLALTGLCLFVVLVLAVFNYLALNSGDHDRSTIDPSVDLTEALHGIESMKLSGREGLTLRKMEYAIVRQSQQWAGVALRSNTLLSFNMWMQRLGMLSTLWVGAILVMDGKMSMGQLVAFQMFASRVFHPAARMAYTIKEMKKALDDLKELADRLNETTPSIKHHFAELVGIEMKKVGFSHGPGKLLLNGVDLDVRRGQKIGIIGESGCGKSTLLKLIVNVYSPQDGSVRINGIDARHLNESLLRMRLALVPQQATLFRGTILDNIAPLGSVAFNEEVFDYIKLVEADGLINAHPDGLERSVSEGGTNFSGGQKQKICLLRALMMKPCVLLLDESTSALDEQTEHRIHESLITQLRYTTIITVTHRPNSLAGYDAIYRMVDGKLYKEDIVRAHESMEVKCEPVL